MRRNSRAKKFIKIKKKDQWLLWNIYHSVLAFFLAGLFVIELIELIKNW